MDKKRNPMKVAFLLLVICAITVGMVGCSEEPVLVGDNNATQATGSSAVETTAPAGDTVFKVGETVELNDAVVCLLGVTESTGSAYNKPTEGNVYVLCEFEITNNKDEDLAVSSMMSFEAYCDDYTCNYSLGALMEKGDKNQLDGTVAAGKKMKGVIGYEVPADWKELEIHFTPDFLSGKDIVFVATNG